MRIRAEGIVLDLTCGACPVQFEGTVDGYPAYFRARYTDWSFTIARPGDEPVWPQHPEGPLFETGGHHDPQEDGFGAGYMEHEHAERLILAAIAEYRALNREGA